MNGEERSEFEGETVAYGRTVDWFPLDAADYDGVLTVGFWTDDGGNPLGWAQQKPDGTWWSEAFFGGAVFNGEAPTLEAMAHVLMANDLEESA